MNTKKKRLLKVPGRDLDGGLVFVRTRLTGRDGKKTWYETEGRLSFSNSTIRGYCYVCNNCEHLIGATVQGNMYGYDHSYYIGLAGSSLEYFDNFELYLLEGLIAGEI